MSGQGVELATAWVRLVPSMDGASDSITKALAPGVKAAEGEGDKAGKGWSTKAKAAMVVGGAAAVAGTVAAFKGLYDIGATFDDVTDTIRVGTGAQGDALDGLVAVAKNVGTSVPAEFEAIGGTVSDLNTRLGLTGGTLETVAKQYLEAGRMLGQEVDINKTTAAFSAFKIEGDEVVGAMDSLFRVSQATGVGMNDLASGIQANAPALQNLGFGFEDSIALLGSLDKAGLNATAITASMSKALVNLAKDGEEPQAAFKRVTGEIQQYVDAGDTAAALDLASQVFGTKGASQFVGALQSGVLNMEDLMAATGATGDTILGVGDETMDFAERWQITMNTAMTAIEPFATAVFTALGDGLKAAMPTLQALGTWVSENTGVLGVIAGVIGVTLVAAMIAWAASIWATTAALLANPITWIIVAIVALVAAVVALAMNWDTVVKWITEVWSGFIGWVTSVIEGFVGWWNGVWTAVGAWIESVWSGFIGGVTAAWSGFVGWLRGVGDNLAAWWNGLWQGVGDFFRGLWDGIVTAASGAINSVWSVLRSVVGGIVTWWNNMWAGMANFYGGIWNGLVGIVSNVGGAFSSVFGGIRDTVAGAFNGIVGIIRGPINGIISLVNGAIGGLNRLSISIPDWVPIVGGQKWGLSLPKIPMLAHGATILPRSGGTLAVLAEAGRPESVVDTGLMNRALEEGLAGSSGAGMTVQGPLLNVEHMSVDSDERVEEVAQALYERAERAERAKGKVSLEGPVTE